MGNNNSDEMVMTWIRLQARNYPKLWNEIITWSLQSKPEALIHTQDIREFMTQRLGIPVKILPSDHFGSFRIQESDLVWFTLRWR